MNFSTATKILASMSPVTRATVSAQDIDVALLCAPACEGSPELRFTLVCALESIQCGWGRLPVRRSQINIAVGVVNDMIKAARKAKAA